jgi:hypothetical protein
MVRPAKNSTAVIAQTTASRACSEAGSDPPSKRTRDSNPSSDPPLRTTPPARFVSRLKYSGGDVISPNASALLPYITIRLSSASEVGNTGKQRLSRILRDAARYSDGLTVEMRWRTVMEAEIRWCLSLEVRLTSRRDSHKRIAISNLSLSIRAAVSTAPPADLFYVLSAGVE